MPDKRPMVDESYQARFHTYSLEGTSCLMFSYPCGTLEHDFMIDFRRAVRAFFRGLGIVFLPFIKQVAFVTGGDYSSNVLIATHLGSEVCKLTFSKFKKLTKDEENEFKIEAASIMYAVVPWVLSIYLVIFDDAIRNNKLEGYSFGAQWNVAFVMGHSFADVLLRYKWSVGRHPSVFIYKICGIGVTGLVALATLPSPLFLYRVMVRLLELDGTTVGVKLRRVYSLVLTFAAEFALLRFITCSTALFWRLFQNLTR
ncbi:unnamed protein product [Clavelina lepadiformis]|uniref:Transmembrane protein 147 n=1 Tax=Clavelina lepadiformis TaxID=159417 RepID=A0ABP0FSY2_CLALP